MDLALIHNNAKAQRPIKFTLNFFFQILYSFILFFYFYSQTHKFQPCRIVSLNPSFSGGTITHSGGNKRSSKSMKRGNKPIPADLITEIFSRLPAKSVARFRSLSKLWASSLCSPDFIELFLTRSSTRPRLLLAVERNGEWLFFSSPQPQNPYEKSVTADYHTKFSGDVCGYICSYASGLIYFPAMSISKEEETAPMICNPITGMYESLPQVMKYRRSKGFLGFNPIDKQFKVFDHCEILTLGTGEQRWRSNSISCPIRSQSEGICIHGVLYYLSETFRVLPGVIVCFDVRSEEIKFIDAECFNDHLDDTSELVLINYKGKLGVINWKYGQAGGRRTLELCMWVLEDVERQEWLKYVYTLPENDSCEFSVAGVTATGEIVLCMKYTCKPFYVFYFNPERNTLQSVEIQGFGANLEVVENRGAVFAFVDHVEDLSLNDAKQLKSSISQVKHLCSCCEEVAQPKFNYEKA